MLNLILKLTLLILEGIKDAGKRQRREDYEETMRKIKEDPVREWNARFRPERMQPPEVVGSSELPTDGSAIAPSRPRRGRAEDG